MYKRDSECSMEINELVQGYVCWLARLCAKLVEGKPGESCFSLEGLVVIRLPR